MVGFGYDSHRLEAGRQLIIGGVYIDSIVGAVAHSDGDVLLHSLCDALLGAAGLGDIGIHFPDSDLKYRDADSSLFVNKIMKMLSENSYQIINIDATILLEKPKLLSYKDSINKNIAKLCNLSVDRVNIKAKTNEGMGFIGNSEGIAAYCICEIQNFQSI